MRTSPAEKWKPGGLEQTTLPRELRDLLAEEATQANDLLVSNREVRLELGRPGKDRNGRTLAYLFSGEVLANEELVRQGWAHMRRPVSVKYRERPLKAQDEARNAGRGIWAGVHSFMLIITEVSPRTSGVSSAALNSEFVVVENRGSNLK